MYIVRTVAFRESLEAKALSIAFSLGMTIGAVACAQSEASPHEPLHDIEAAITAIALGTTIAEKAPQTTCIEPTEDDLKAVDALLDQPENPLIDKLIGGGKEENIYEQEFAKFRQAKAQELGLHVYDATPYQNVFYEGDPSQGIRLSPNLTFEQELKPVQAYMSLLGVTVSVEAPGTTYAYGGRAPEAAELESMGTKFTLLGLLQAYNEKPKEYIETSGLKRIILVTGTAKNEVAGYVDAAVTPGTIYADIEQGENVVLSMQGFNHEEAHLLDAQQCTPEGMSNDPGFIAVSPPDLYRGIKNDTETPHYTSDSSGTSFETNSQNRRFKLRPDTPPEVYCQIEKIDTAEAATVQSFSAYHPDPAEEKAEIGSQIAEPFSYEIITDKRFTQLWPQVRYQMARLYQQAPNVMKYFAAIGRRAPESQC